MPATIVLTALPAKYLRGEGDEAATLLIMPFGRKLGLAIFSAATLPGVMKGVADFADTVHRELPDYSFYVSVRIRRGDRAPAGFSKAHRDNLLCQDAHTRVVDSCACPRDFDGRLDRGAAQ